jgi:hypothetical protein
MLPGIIFIIISTALFLMAYLLYFKQAYWLISGVNFSPRETVNERYDIPGLTRHLGRMCALIGLVMLISGIGAFAGSDILFAGPILSVFLIVPAFLFGTERYMYVGRKTQRIINITITALMGVVLVFIVTTTVAGMRAPEINIRDGNLEIKSMYGTEIPLDSIQRVDMVDLKGRMIGKLNGFNMGDNMKGTFSVENLGTVTLYQQGEPCRSVRIETGGKTYLINLGSETENINLKSQIMRAMERR